MGIIGMVRWIAMIGALISFLIGCARKPADAPAVAPGTSARLSYPVLLTGQGRLVVKDDELSLTSTTVSSGLNFPEFQLIDSGGARYSIRKVTEFGKKSAFFDMGTTPFRVFLEMKSEGPASLSSAKSLVLAAAGQAGKQAIDGAQSHAELIDACRRSWEWR